MNYEAIAKWSQVVGSALFVAAVVWVWIKYIQPAVLRAQSAANAQIAEAERRRDAAKAALGTLQADIEVARSDAAGIKERVAAEAQAERDAALREARESGERAVRNAQKELERSRAAARAALRGEMIERALRLARERAAARVDDAFNAELAESFVKSLEPRETVRTR